MSELTLHVERMSYGPDAIAHTSDGKTVFISGGAVPGDTVSVQITEDTDRFSRAQLVKVLEASAFREPRPNPFVALTGATPWGNIIYEQQLVEKTQRCSLCS